ncbi:MAG: hypothetical protein VW873_09965 [Betaproteobacteria bacterium]
MKKPKLNLSVQVATESTNLPTKKEFRNWMSQGIFEDIDLTLRLGKCIAVEIYYLSIESRIVIGTVRV